MINSVLTEHANNVADMDILYNYANGAPDILERVRTTGLPNNMLAHAYPSYIVAMSSGYLVGNPVSYSVELPAQEAALKALQDAYDATDVQSVDSELALQAAIYGRGVELCYANKQAKPRTATLDPRTAFVVYDDTVEYKPLFGVYYIAKLDESGASVGYQINVYTDTVYAQYRTMEFAVSDAPTKLEPHNFGAIPMVEYWNNSTETGDFVRVISLIDAYDLLESDRVNDKQQFADALLVLTGCVGFNESADATDTRTPAERLRENKLISLPDKDASAQWLTKQLNEADADVLRNALKSDIHKFSMVPDLTDEQFAGNSSGVAMKYKLLGLEQLTKVKERWFREALRTRLRLFSNFLNLLGGQALDADAVQMTFTRSLPINELETAQMVQALKGIVPDEILVKQVPFVQDADAAMEMMKQQRADALKDQQAVMGTYPDANADNQDADKGVKDDGV